MSTFKGCLEEFPDIRIDYFRDIAGKRRPLAGFLSHIHSDHIQGLENFRGVFVYCSPATRELLLNLEKYSHRMNLAKGYIECRKQDYKDLGKRLRTIPLNTPTEIELPPRTSLRITLLDANHCAGAVMFLIEDNAKAILYTGDVRSEPWWINSLARNPVVLPYTHGHKRLDMMYLDTTFASEKNLYRKFPTKAEGLKELLDKVMEYPKETIFHFHAWTPGYEDVWIALSSALRSQIHVDDYKCRLYGSLASMPNSKQHNHNHEGPALIGFRVGNQRQAGCLTSDQSVRLHSCELDTACAALNGNGDVVFITPIISRSASGAVLPEVGAGGGGGDLELQTLELELDDEETVVKLMKVCSETIVDHDSRKKTLDIIDQARRSQKQSVSLSVSLDGDQMSFTELAKRIAKVTNRGESVQEGQDVLKVFDRQRIQQSTDKELPRTIDFPYSRHSSYEELCQLVKAFMPKDVYPCTVVEETWTSASSVEQLFGRFCSATTFAHDRQMESLVKQRSSHSPQMADDNEGAEPSQTFTSSREGSVGSQISHSDGALHMDMKQSFVDPTLYLHQTSERTQHSKRRRLGPPSAYTDQRRFYQSSRRLHDLRESFSAYLTQRESMKHGSAALKVETLTKVRERTGPAIRENGTQMKPIELSDTTSSSSDDDAGDFLLTEMPVPNCLSNLSPVSPSRPDTQLSVSDAAFESQSPHHPKATTKGADRLQRRKEAYKAAKDMSGVFETDLGLISSFDGHGEEELEL